MVEKGNKEIMTVGYKKIQLNIPINHFLKFWDEYTKENCYVEKAFLNYFK